MISYAVGVAIGVAVWWSWMSDATELDPSYLAALLFMSPLGVAMAGAAHVTVGLTIGIGAAITPALGARRIVVATAVTNGGLSFLPSLYGAGVMGLGWWVIGAALSAALMLTGAWIVHMTVKTFASTRG